MSRHPNDDASKKMLGRYRIEAELGRGGMGVVYLATDENTGRRVALKTTSVSGLGSAEKSRNQRRERFIREVRALTQVNHENVVHVFDAGECDHPDFGWLLFYTMEYVEGTTLASLVQERGPMDGGAAAAVVRQVAAGLGAAHKQGIIHRDVKPANIFLSVDGRALIGDFGIAKIEGSTQITRRDQLVGTLNYLAPEQILGDDVSPATDVFALGALFYVITQNRPLRQQIDATALLASAHGDEPLARMLATTNLQEALKRVMARALERDPRQRIKNGSDLAEELTDHATAVPALVERQKPSIYLTEHTGDISSAFASLSHVEGPLPSAEADEVTDDSAGFAGQDEDGVEAAAVALLGEVDRRASGSFHVKDGRPVLPVAQTESTVMFNLRALEAEGPRRTSSSPFLAAAAPLPVPSFPPIPPAPGTPLVALTEATGDDDAPPFLAATSPITEPDARPASSSSSSSSSSSLSSSSASAEGRAVEADDGRSHTPITVFPVRDGAEARERSGMASGPVPVAPAASAGGMGPDIATDPTLITSVLGASSSWWERHRGPLRAAGLGAGLLAGALVMVALSRTTATSAPERPLRTTTTPAVVPATSAARPLLCQGVDVTVEAAAQAAALLDDVRQAQRAGLRESGWLAKLNKAAALDGTNHEIFFVLSQVSKGQAALDADTCVCLNQPTSKECLRIRSRARP